MVSSRFSQAGRWIQRRLKRHGFLTLFGLALALSLVLGTGTPLRPQTLSPSPQGAMLLCEEIRKLAQDDVDDDILRRTSYAVDSFKVDDLERKVGLSVFSFRLREKLAFLIWAIASAWLKSG